MFNRINIADKDLYAIAGQEIANDVVDIGLWTKAIADSNGDIAVARIKYLKMRVLDLTQQRTAQQTQLAQTAANREAQRAQQERIDLLQWESEEIRRKAAHKQAEWDRLFSLPIMRLLTRMGGKFLVAAKIVFFIVVLLLANSYLKIL